MTNTTSVIRKVADDRRIAKIIPTVIVTIKSTGKRVRINEDRYDPNIHKLENDHAEGQRLRKGQESGQGQPQEESGSSNGQEQESSQVNLDNLTVAELRQLPEWELVENKSELTKRTDIVAAIEAVRDQIDG